MYFTAAYSGSSVVLVECMIAVLYAVRWVGWATSVDSGIEDIVLIN